MSNYLRQLQQDVEFRLLAAPELATVPVFAMRKAMSADKIKERVGSLNARGGKTGACVIVLMPELQVPSPNVPGPHYRVALSCLVIENPEVNALSTGTGLSAEEIALKVLQLVHQFTAFGFAQCLTAAARAVQPDDSIEGTVGYVVNFETLGGSEKPAKVSTPSIAPSSGAAPQSVTLACATSGASVYYTTDGSYPCSANTAATAYSAPFNVATAAVVRAAAEKSGLLPSDVNVAKFT